MYLVELRTLLLYPFYFICISIDTECSKMDNSEEKLLRNKIYERVEGKASKKPNSCGHVR